MRLLLSALVLGALAGCDRPAPPPPAPPDQADAPVDRRSYAGIDYVLPPGWTAEEAMGGVLLMSPTVEANWQANLFLERRADEEGRTLEQALDDLAPGLAQEKENFHEVARNVADHPNGFRYATLDYTSTSDGTPLNQRETILDLGGGARLFVLASAASSTQGTYGPVFQSFLDSITTTSTPG